MNEREESRVKSIAVVSEASLQWKAFFASCSSYSVLSLTHCTYCRSLTDWIQFVMWLCSSFHLAKDAALPKGMVLLPLTPCVHEWPCGGRPGFVFSWIYLSPCAAVLKLKWWTEDSWELAVRVLKLPVWIGSGSSTSILKAQNNFLMLAESKMECRICPSVWP